jgi:hypothetical protein
MAVKEYTYVVRSNPVPGREEEYNRWYSERHLADVVAVPGFVSAQRFKMVETGADGAPEQRYMALYNLRTDDPISALDLLRSLVETGAMNMSEAISQTDLVTILYETITPIVTPVATPIVPPAVTR